MFYFCRHKSLSVYRSKNEAYLSYLCDKYNAMKSLLIFFLLAGTALLLSLQTPQSSSKPKPNYKIDTIINKGIYQSYFNYKCREPIFVVYKLYKGGGDCSRAGFHFTNDTKIVTATSKDYAASGYDEGHLANAEDFAGQCTSEELTFRFYNCCPQCPNLNRGTWKHWETEIRKESQTDSLLIIAGNFYGSKKIGQISVPSYCWKVVESLSTKKLIHIFLFTNTDEATYKTVSLSKIETELGYKLPLKN